MEQNNSVFKILSPNKNTYLVVIKINNIKTLTDFSEKMPPSDKKDYELLHHETKKQEFLAGRLALQQALTLLEHEYKGIKKDENGKPYLIDYQIDYKDDNKENNIENIHISLSHSYPFACALVSKQVSRCAGTLSGACGVDIEQPKEKVLKVASRVFSENEIIFLEKDLTKNTVFWCAKEVLYKIYGKGEVNFKENLFIFPFENQTENQTESSIKNLTENSTENENIFKVLAEIKMPDFNQKYTLNVTFLEDFVLCYGTNNS